MLINQNTILASPRNGYYEEYVLDSATTGNVMPGALLCLKGVDEVQADGVETAVLTTAPADGADLASVEAFVVIENALLGKSINHKAYPGEVTGVYRPVSGDRFLARAVAGNYVEGDPLYYTQTNNGIYFTKVGTTGQEIKAFAAESFVIPAATNTATNPPFFYDQVDDSTTERPSSVNMNGGYVNLLRIRIA